MARALEYLKRQSGDKIIVNTKSRTEVVLLSQLKYIEVVNHKVTYHLVGRKFTVVGSMTKPLNDLSDKNFRLCHKSYLVNLEHVDSVIGGKNVVIGDISLPLSRCTRKIL